MPVERYLVDAFLLTAVSAVQLSGARMAWSAFSSPRARWWIRTATAASIALLFFAVSTRFSIVSGFLPAWVPGWGRGTVILWAFFSVLMIGAIALVRRLRVEPQHSPARRTFLRTSQAAALAVPVGLTGYGTFIQRFGFVLQEQDIAIPGLHPDLDGLRLVQLTDIHLSPFLSVRELQHVVGMANETQAHVALVTGDLISRAGDPLDDCLRELARVRSTAGTFGCLGNHEVYAEAEDYTAHHGAKLGLRFLRQEAAELRFGAAGLNLAGVDYQEFREPYLVGAERLRKPDALNIMLSHNPDVFPVAARQGYPLTIAGHTHGGQVRVEILRQEVNVARFFTPYTNGLYERDGARVYVSRGIGTIGMPARLGAPPEVNLLRLCRS